MALAPIAAPPPGTVPQSTDAISESEAAETIFASHSGVMNCWIRHGHRENGKANRFVCPGGNPDRS